MPSPTLATFVDRLQDLVKLVHNLLVDAADYGPLVDAILANSATPRSTLANHQAEEWLRAVASVIGGNGAAAAEPELQAFAEGVTSYPANDAQAALTILYRHFVDYPLRVRSRGINFGSLTPAAGNTWNGIVQRQLVDEEGHELEAVTIERKVWECVADARVGDGGEAGAPHREFFVVRGENVNLYGIDETGTGLGARPQVRSPFTESLLSDPVWTAGTFATRPAAGVPQVATALSAAWAAGALAHIQFSVDDLPRTYKGNPPVFKAVFKDQGSTADNSLTQTASRWQAAASDLFCYHAEFWVRRKSSGDGTVTIRLGSKTATLDLTSISNDTWTRLRLSDGTDNKGWPRAWNQASTTFAIELSGNTTGELEVAYPMVTPLDFINGTAWALLPGTAEAKVGDEVEVSDALDGSDSKIQQMLVRWFRRYLPHCGTATPVTASGGRTFTFAAAGRTLTASSGNFVSDGYKPGMRVPVTGATNQGGLISTVAATVLTFHSTVTVVDEGPLSATAAITGVPFVEDPS